MNINEIIDRELSKSKETNPHVIGRRVVAKFSQEQKEELVIYGSILRVRERIKNIRSKTVNEISETRTGPTRQNSLRKKREIERIYLGDGEWKIHSECNVSDLMRVAEQYRLRGDKEYSRAKEFENEADILKTSGFASVGEMLLHAQRKVA